MAINSCSKRGPTCDPWKPGPWDYETTLYKIGVYRCQVIYTMYRQGDPVYARYAAALYPCTTPRPVIP